MDTRNFKGIALPEGVIINRSNHREAICIRYFAKDADGKLKDRKKQNREWVIGKCDEKGEFTSNKERDLTAASIVAAGKAWAKLQYDIEDGRHVVGAANAGTTTMGELFDAYLRQCVREKMKGNVLAKKRQHIDCWLRDRWNDVPANELTVKAVKDWLKGIRDGDVLPVEKEGSRRPEGLIIRPSTMKQIMAPFHAAIESDEGQEAFSHNGNPLKGNISLKKIWGKNNNGSREDYKVNPLSADDKAKILKVATPAQARMYQTWWDGGYRASEFGAIKWECVDLDLETVTIKRQWVKVDGKLVLVDYLKSDAGARVVQLSKAAVQALREQKAAAVQDIHGFVFTNTKGQPYREPNSHQSQWRTLLKRAGVTYRNPEQCRHTFASTLLPTGYPVSDVAKMMGHKNSQTIHKYYEAWLPPSHKTKNGFLPFPVAA